MRFTERLQRAETLEEVYDAALDAIMRALDCQRASILLFDDSDSMRFVASRWLSEEYRRAVDGHSPWTRATNNPQPICYRRRRRQPTCRTSSSARSVKRRAFRPSPSFR